MAITVTILQRQFDDMHQSIAALGSLFEKFRSYTNRQFNSLSERLDSIEKTMVTKEDSRHFATKDDLRDFVTKDDFARLENLIKTLIAQKS